MRVVVEFGIQTLEGRLVIFYRQSPAHYLLKVVDKLRCAQLIEQTARKPTSVNQTELMKMEILHSR